MDQTYDQPLFADAREEPDHSGKKRAKIFLVVLLVFAGLVALAVAMQKSQPKASGVTTETTTAVQSGPAPVDATANPAAPALSQAVPSAPEAPAAAPTAEKSAVETAPAVSERRPAVKKKAASHGRTIVTETPVPSSPAPAVAPPQLAPVPITAPVAPAPIPTTTPAPATSTTTPPEEVPPPPPV